MYEMLAEDSSMTHPEIFKRKNKLKTSVLCFINKKYGYLKQRQKECECDHLEVEDRLLTTLVPINRRLEDGGRYYFPILRTFGHGFRAGQVQRLEQFLLGLQ